LPKPNRAHIFNIREGDRFYQHITARCMSSMEIMFMTLGEPICNSSIAVRFLSTDPPSMRTRAIMPVPLILQNEEDLIIRILLKNILLAHKLLFLNVLHMNNIIASLTLLLLHVDQGLEHHITTYLATG